MGGLNGKAEDTFSLFYERALFQLDGAAVIRCGTFGMGAFDIQIDSQIHFALPFPDSLYNTHIMLGSLCYMLSPKTMLSALFQILLCRGRIVFCS